VSISITTDIHCDDCQLWIEGVTSTRQDTGEARMIAKRAGWSYRARYNGHGGFTRVDLCPQCAAADDAGTPRKDQT
jgi:hypothetical protein